jgi:hypothetical protein
MWCISVEDPFLYFKKNISKNKTHFFLDYYNLIQIYVLNHEKNFLRIILFLNGTPEKECKYRRI